MGIKIRSVLHRPSHMMASAKKPGSSDFQNKTPVLHTVLLCSVVGVWQPLAIMEKVRPAITVTIKHPIWK